MTDALKQEMYEFNREIIEELVEDGANPEAFFDIEHHFASEDFATLEKAAIGIFKEGLEVSDAEEFETEEGERIFSFDVVIEQQLDVNLLDKDTDRMVTLADKFDVEYDGWGTYLEEDE